ncbi:PC4/YdbC family ssDNA-binding protein [Methylobrevis pamukkalensis]|uniref:Transcriptional coactivator p15 (PC4) C-terminal domain-containing protein n=1 Tax=Methylobrevis pamukkalensis TaxID=1439726 RepID=A0A1E3GYU2_9HYPH|nr:PC4/YdbC family ssDNA-binding protein [Methylobrevis pamukkalensis]ODN69230.1 hypothetical protein A6302_03492 [Methylobrevis pamukkalensis]
MTDAADTATLVAKVRKNGHEDIVVRLDTYHGVDCCDVRVFADYDGTGERRPTRKGVAFRVDVIPALIEALHAAAEAYQEAQGR